MANVVDVVDGTHPSERRHGPPNFLRQRSAFVELDALDRALLRELQDDARQTNRELAVRTG
ncbi:Lrp/AsnC family transcriptional regulator, partial [Streptomyces sp. NPDC020125]|uniref:Lrp/AsnC family transcriptional regulator n=1 Tax=Streptomyces sp. NPDC020125 TaxID=3154593 RepID=UPI00340C70BD